MENSRWGVADTLLSLTELKILRSEVKHNKDWAKEFPGFRPDSLQRQQFLRGRAAFARSASLLRSLCFAFLRSIDVRASDVAIGFALAADRKDLPPEVLAAVSALSVLDIPSLPPRLHEDEVVGSSSALVSTARAAESENADERRAGERTSKTSRHVDQTELPALQAVNEHGYENSADGGGGHETASHQSDAPSLGIPGSGASLAVASDGTTQRTTQVPVTAGMPTPIPPPDLRYQASRERLLHFLSLGGEADDWDFKRSVPTETPDFLSLVKDILAFANHPTGGHLVFGVEDGTWDKLGIGAASLDTTKLYDQFRKYSISSIQFTSQVYEVKSSELPNCTWDNARRFGILYVAPYADIAAPSRDGNYNIRGQNKVFFRAGDIYIRSGARSEIVTDYLSFLRAHQQSADALPQSTRPLVCQLKPQDSPAQRFIGRQRELHTLWQWFKNPNAVHRWLLTGDGGKGKSELAYEFAYQVRSAAPEGYAAVLALSAKRREYTQGGVRELSPDFTDLSSLLHALCDFYAANDHDDFLELALGDKKSLALDWLNEMPALLVADDVDSIRTDDSEVLEFIAGEIPRTGSRVLITSRAPQKLAGFGLTNSVTQVEGFEESSALEFIHAVAARYGMAEKISDDDAKRIAAATDYSPLYLDDFVRGLKKRSLRELLKYWSALNKRELLYYSVGREFDSLSRESRSVLFACCLADGRTNHDSLSAVTSLSRDQVDEAIEEAQGLFLLGDRSFRDGVECFSLNSNTRDLVLELGRTEYGSQLETVRKKHGDIVTRARIGTTSDPAVLDVLRQSRALELRNTRESFEQAEQLLGGYLGEEQYEDNPDLVGRLARLHARWPRGPHLIEARRLFERAANLESRSADMYLDWIRMEVEEGNWPGAERATRRAIEKSGYSNAFRMWMGRSLVEVGNAARASLDQVTAAEKWREALTWLDALVADLDKVKVPERRLRRDALELATSAARALNQTDRAKRYAARLEMEADGPAN